MSEPSLRTQNIYNIAHGPKGSHRDRHGFERGRYDFVNLFDNIRLCFSFNQLKL